MFGKKNQNIEQNHSGKLEMDKFHLMLQKMKSNRPNFNVVSIMKMIYGKKFNGERN